MARLISEYYANQPDDTIPHAAATPRKPQSEVDSELSESISEASASDSLIGETVAIPCRLFMVLIVQAPVMSETHCLPHSRDPGPGWCAVLC